MMEYVEFQSGPNTLRGMMHLPGGDAPFPCVLFCHGFTGNRVESHFLFVTIARRLEAAGIASLRFDFAGSGESDGEFDEMTMSSEIADAAAALDFLAGRSDVGKLGLIGLSLGGAIAALLAGRRGGDVAALALMSAVAEPGRILSFIRTGKFEAQLAQQDYVDWDGLKVRRRFLQDLETHHPAAAAAEYPGPVLIIHGGEDATIPPSEAYTYRRSRENSPAETRFEILRDADHTYRTVEHTEEVCRLLEAFFAENLSG